MRPSAGRHGQGEQDFIGLGCVTDPDIHGVEVRHDVDLVLVEEGDVNASARPSDFLGGRDDGLASANCLSDRRPKGGIHEGSRVLKFTGLANDTRLSVTLYILGIDHLQDSLDEQFAERFAGFDQLGQIFNIATGERVGDHGDRGTAGPRGNH